MQTQDLEAPAFLPPAADNSAGLPPVGDQGAQGSCASWACGYYMKSYQEAKEHGWSLNDPTNLFSPAFLYNQLQYYDEGSTFQDNLDLLNEQGCATLATMPYSDTNYRSWPTTGAYREGIPYRSLSYDYLGHGETPAVFNAVKAILASGDLCAVGIPIFRPNPTTPGRFDLMATGDNEYDLPPAADMYLAGYHALAIVGYDESRFGGLGGYKIVNSWGTQWGEDGFGWLSEPFLNTFGFDFHQMHDRTAYTPTALVHFKVHHSYWWYDNVIVTVGVGPTGAPVWSKALNKRLHVDSVTIDRWADISEAVELLPPDWDTRWWIRISDNSSEDVATLSSFDIESDGTSLDATVVLPLKGPFFGGNLRAYIPAGGTPSDNYYVNDSATAGDIYCTTPGDDANDGLTPATPKSSLQSIIDRYTLRPGNVVWIDAGTYNLTAPVTIDNLDRGADGNPLRFVGALAPNGEPATVFQRPAGSGYVWHVIGTQMFLNLENMQLHGGTNGLYFDGSWAYGGDHLTAINSLFSNASGHGISLYEAQPMNLMNCRIYGFGGTYGIAGLRSTVNLENSTLVASGRTGIRLSSSSSDFASNAYASMTNSILTASGSGAQVISLGAYSSVTSARYNTLHASQGATIGFTPNDTNITVDPLLADSTNGDLHVISTAGRWDPLLAGGAGGWVIDSEDSPCIDAGEFTADFSQEPVPNGGRINIGAYGGTSRASLSSMSYRYLFIDEPVAGQVYRKTCPITWRHYGDGWQSGNTLRAEYSMDAGETWVVISGASELNYEVLSYNWNLAGMIEDATYALRLVCNQVPSTSVTVDGLFMIGAHRDYYVNDADTTDDVYCTAPGDDANDGHSPATPKAAIQSILDAYDLGPGDTVFIDTGNYVLGANITITSQDGGDLTGYVTFQGSTHPAGTWIDRNSTSASAYAIYANGAAYLAFENLRITGGYNGIRFSSSRYSRVSNCRIYASGHTGVNVASSEGFSLRNSVVDRNGYFGLYLNDTKWALLINNTLSLNANHQVYIGSYSSITVANNVFCGAGYQCIHRSSTTSSLGVDFNAFHLTGSATVGFEGTNAMYVNPLFAGPDGLDAVPGTADDDYHLMSTAGRWVGGAWTADAFDSPCIDAGDPAVDPGMEPAPNGGRINLGAYGGTGQASKTPAGRSITITQPNGGEVWHGTQEIRWHLVGLGWTDGDTVNLEYSTDGGANWQGVSGGADVDYAEGGFLWDTTAAASSHDCLIRAACSQDAAASDASDARFTIHNEPFSYYVNDSDTTDDVYCTAPGDDANDGLNPGTPKATVQAILDAYNLEPGDTVYIDTGHYVLNANITITSQDAGDPAGHVTFQGSTHPAGTLLDRNSTSSGAYGIMVDGAGYLAFRNLRVTGANYGVALIDADNCRISHCRFYGNRPNHGLYINSRWVILENSVIDRNQSCGIYLASTANSVLLKNNTIALNGSYQIDSLTSGVIIRNNVLWAGGTSACVDGPGTGSLVADYNAFYLTDSATVGYAGTNALYVDPLFVDSEGPDGIPGTADDDYHLMSTAGSWHGGVWAADAYDSPCIDAGDPSVVPGMEPVPNGGRINLGAYGGTGQASKTPVGRALFITQPNGGEFWRGVQEISWHVAGLGWADGDTVQLEYSTDDGATWQGVSGGAALDYAEGGVLWDTTAAASSHHCLIRASCNQEPETSDTSDARFSIHNEPFNYYVNDGDPTDDVYCTAPGDDANDGLNPGTPKTTVQAILDAYRLLPGDTVYIDTGHYVLNANITITSQDAGDPTGHVTFQGSTHPAGTWVDRNSISSSAYAIYANGAAYLSFQYLRITGGYNGMRFSSSQNCRVSDCRIYANGNTGVLVASSGGFSLRNSVVDRNGYYGFYLNDTKGALLVNNTLSLNANHQVYIGSYSSITVENNVLCGAGNQCIYRSSTTSSLGVNVNAFHLTGSATVGFEGTNAMYVDPLFVDPDGPDGIPGTADDDYHLMSTAGRWAGGAWTTDATDSPCLDAGDPAADPGLEPAPNGGRINLGAYGDSDQASKSPTFLRVVSPNGGEHWRGSGLVRWYINDLTWFAGDTVSLYYSDDAGASWSPIIDASGLPGDLRAFEWDLTGLVHGTEYRVRVVHDQDPQNADESDGTFSIGGIYFVNDSSTDGDEWCTTPGSSLHDGQTIHTPKDSVQAILDAYDLEPGDTIFIDAGTYNLSANIVVASADGGSAAGRVRLLGVKNQTILDRGAPSASNSACVRIDAAYVTIENLTCRNAYHGIYITETASYPVVKGSIITGCGSSGIYVDEAKYALIQNNCLTHAGSAAAIRAVAYLYYGYYALPLEIVNNTIVTDNSTGIDVYANGGPVLKNNIVMASGTGKFCLSAYDALAIQASEYNNLFSTNGAKVGRIYQYEASTLGEWRNGMGWDTQSISVDPLFADATNGDYRLRSTEGRWEPAENGGAGGWVADAVISPCIDAGDPNDLVGDESSPNGGRINFGAYGGTAEASKSPASGRWLVFDGGGLRSPLHAWESLRWSVRGANWSPGETVRLEVSDDSGNPDSWSVIPGAENLLLDDVQYWWNTTTVPNGESYRFRVVTNSVIPASGTSERDYTVHNEIYLSGSIWATY